MSVGSVIRAQDGRQVVRGVEGLGAFSDVDHISLTTKVQRTLGILGARGC